MGRGGGEMRASFSSRYAAADGEGALLLLLLVIALPLRVPMMFEAIQAASFAARLREHEREYDFINQFFFSSFRQ